MINLSSIAGKIQDQLNNASNNSGVSFVIFSDTAQYEKAKRTLAAPNDYDKPINGLATVVSNEITPNQANMLVSSMTVRIEVCVPCLPTNDRREVKISNIGVNKDGTWEQGNSDRIEQIRSIIDGVTAGQWADYFSSDNKNYTVTCAYTFANTGIRSSRLQAGDSVTFSFFAYLNIIETGENSRADIFYLDGNIIPYVKATISRKQTTEADVAQGDFAAKATSTGGIFTITLAFPSFVSAYSKVIKDFLLYGESNTVHILSGKVGREIADDGEIETPIIKLVYFDTADRSAEGVMNVGMTATFVEAWDDYELMNIPQSLVQGQAYDFANAPLTLKTYSYIKFQNPAVGFIYNTATGITPFIAMPDYTEVDGETVLSGYVTDLLKFTDSVISDGTFYEHGGTIIVATETPLDIIGEIN